MPTGIHLREVNLRCFHTHMVFHFHARNKHGCWWRPVTSFHCEHNENKLTLRPFLQDHLGESAPECGRTSPAPYWNGMAPKHSVVLYFMPDPPRGIAHPSTPMPIWPQIHWLAIHEWLTKGEQKEWTQQNFMLDALPVTTIPINLGFGPWLDTKVVTLVRYQGGLVKHINSSPE